VVAAFALIAAACGDDDDSSSAGSSGAAPDISTCPDPLIVQTDWFPQPEHGYTYNLIGTDGVVDAENGTYTGELGDTGITMEIRAGGPFVGFSPPSAQFYTDSDIFMAYVDTGTAIRDSGTLPVVAVYAAWEKSPQMLMFGTDTFDFENFEEIGDSGETVLYFEGSAYMDFLIGRDLLNRDQVDASYDGGPSRFVTESLVQQGFVTNEPYRYENDFEDYLKPVTSLLIHESGFEIYDGSLSVKPASITDDAACLAALVPMIQQSQADFMANPDAMNQRLDEIVKELNSSWTSSIGLHTHATDTMRDLGLVTDGDNDFVGDMDADRIDTLIGKWVPILEDLGLDSMKDDLKASDISTNQFLDESIGLGF
jgi:hypothetical protein